MWIILDLIFFVACLITGLIFWTKEKQKYAVIYFVLSLIFLINLCYKGTTEQLDEIKNLIDNVETKQVEEEIE